MSETLIIEITFGILLSIGSFVLFILAFKLFYKYIIQEKRCTSKVKGIIKKYTLATRGGENSGIHLPVVHYIVNGKEYKVVGPEYKEENQILKINRTSNSFAGVYNNPIEELYPINSEIDVYYDPSNPKLSYVLRYCNKKWLFYLTFCSALLTLVIDLLILFLL